VAHLKPLLFAFMTLLQHFLFPVTSFRQQTSLSFTPVRFLSQISAFYIKIVNFCSSDTAFCARSICSFLELRLCFEDPLSLNGNNTDPMRCEIRFATTTGGPNAFGYEDQRVTHSERRTGIINAARGDLDCASVVDVVTALRYQVRNDHTAGSPKEAGIVTFSDHLILWSKRESSKEICRRCAQIDRLMRPGVALGV